MSLLLRTGCSFYFSESRCRKVGERCWLTFLSRSLPYFGLLPLLNYSMICLLRLILSFSRSYSLMLALLSTALPR